MLAFDSSFSADFKTAADIYRIPYDLSYSLYLEGKYWTLLFVDLNENIDLSKTLKDIQNNNVHNITQISSQRSESFQN